MVFFSIKSHKVSLYDNPKLEENLKPTSENKFKYTNCFFVVIKMSLGSLGFEHFVSHRKHHWINGLFPWQSMICPIKTVGLTAELPPQS